MVCNNCGQFYPDDEIPEKCTVCGDPLEGSVVKSSDGKVLLAGVAPVDKPRLEEPAVQQNFVQEESAERELEAFEMITAKREPEIPGKSKIAPDRGPSGPSGPSGATPARPARPPVAPVQLVKSISPPKDDTPLDPQYMETISSFDENEAIITVIGYGGSGKSFFVNRLRHDLAGSWKRKPGPADEIRISPGGIELTRFMPRSGGPSYLVLDCAGESFSDSFRTQGRTEELTGSAMRPYLAALALARAFVLVIKAEDLLTYSQPDRSDELEAKREDRKFIRKMLTEFDDIIHAIRVANTRLLGGEKPESILRRGISREELKREFKKARRCAQPMYVALSLADRLAALQGESYDMDPFLFALESAPVLFKTIDQSFDHYRFDFLTAFHGHGGLDVDESAEVLDPEEETKRNFRPNYGRKSYGAVEAFEWIHGMVGVQQLQAGGRPGRPQDGLPTRKLVELRRNTDSKFRAAWGR